MTRPICEDGILICKYHARPIRSHQDAGLHLQTLREQNDPEEEQERQTNKSIHLISREMTQEQQCEAEEDEDDEEVEYQTVTPRNMIKGFKTTTLPE